MKKTGLFAGIVLMLLTAFGESQRLLRVGGVFLLVERVEHRRFGAENMAVAAEVLAPVWGCGN